MSNKNFLAAIHVYLPYAKMACYVSSHAIVKSATEGRRGNVVLDFHTRAESM